MYVTSKLLYLLKISCVGFPVKKKPMDKYFTHNKRIF